MELDYSEVKYENWSNEACKIVEFNILLLEDENPQNVHEFVLKPKKDKLECDIVAYERSAYEYPSMGNRSYLFEDEVSLSDYKNTPERIRKELLLRFIMVIIAEIFSDHEISFGREGDFYTVDDPDEDVQNTFKSFIKAWDDMLMSA